MKNSQCSLSIGCLEKWKNILFRSLLYTIQITSYQKTSGLSAVPLLRQQVSIFINQRSFGQRERIVDTDDQNDHRDFFGKKELYLPLDMLRQQHVIPPKWLLKNTTRGCWSSTRRKISAYFSCVFRSRMSLSKTAPSSGVSSRRRLR